MPRQRCDRYGTACRRVGSKSNSLAHWELRHRVFQTKRSQSSLWRRPLEILAHAACCPLGPSDSKSVQFSSDPFFQLLEAHPPSDQLVGRLIGTDKNHPSPNVAVSLGSPNTDRRPHLAFLLLPTTCQTCNETSSSPGEQRPLFPAGCLLRSAYQPFRKTRSAEHKNEANQELFPTGIRLVQ